MLDARWIERNAARFDVLHLHFGAESYTPEHVGAALAAARRAGKPVVYTVHDLQNPQLELQDAHDRMLDVIVPAADVLVTLTPTARDEIAERWGREAIVLAHPRIWESDDPAPVGRESSMVRVGTHLRDLRPNIDGLGVVTTLVRAVAGARATGVRLHATVRMNERVRDEATAELVQQVVAEHEGIELIRAPRLSDLALAEALAELDACVLPYRHGTHSGWLELCHDLAVPVVGPRIGHFGSQHPDDYFGYDIGDPVSLVGAIERATRPAWSRPGSEARASEVAARTVQRAAELVEVRRSHTRLYRSLTERVAA